MRVLDLFAGLRGWSDPWAARGHEVFTVDLSPRFEVDLHADVAELAPSDLPWRPDVVLASPPCERFSVLQIGRNWTPPPEHAPRTPEAQAALDLVRATVSLIRALDPAFFVVENPVGKLRKLPSGLERVERRMVTYCSFGLPNRKPTDLWGGFPPSLVLAPPCRQGAPCHVAAPRGSRTATQGGALAAWYEQQADQHGSRSKATLAALRSKIPEALALAVCQAAEADHAEGLRWAPGDLFGAEV